MGGNFTNNLQRISRNLQTVYKEQVEIYQQFTKNGWEFYKQFTKNK